MSKNVPKIPDFIFYFSFFKMDSLAFSVRNTFLIYLPDFSVRPKKISSRKSNLDIYDFLKMSKFKKSSCLSQKGQVSGMIDYFKYFSMIFTYIMQVFQCFIGDRDSTIPPYKNVGIPLMNFKTVNYFKNVQVMGIYMISSI